MFGPALAHPRLPPPLSLPQTSPAHHANATADQSAWAWQMLRRLRAYFWLKAFGITVFMGLFFVGYFHILRNPVRPVLQMPLTALDLAIGHQPAALLAYVSLWVYVGIAPGMFHKLRHLVLYGLWAAALCGTGLLIFYLAPTAVPPYRASIDLLQYPGFAILQGVDAAGNACPSLHVATALFSAVWTARFLQHIGAPLWGRLVNWLWLALIVYSTLAIKQHVVLDVVAGVALGGAFAWASLRWFPRQVWLPMA